MFHLSLPVAAFPECIAFYRDCFGADVVMLNERTANLYVFGGQLTLHDKPGSAFGTEQREEMHFGHVVSDDDWLAIHERVRTSAHKVLRCVVPVPEMRTRGKLLVADPSGNIVEINSGLPIAGTC
jgi:extradiol dioxygenase family protein